MLTKRRCISFKRLQFINIQVYLGVRSNLVTPTFKRVKLLIYNLTLFSYTEFYRAMNRAFETFTPAL